MTHVITPDSDPRHPSICLSYKVTGAISMPYHNCCKTLIFDGRETRSVESYAGGPREITQLHRAVHQCSWLSAVYFAKHFPDAFAGDDCAPRQFGGTHKAEQCAAAGTLISASGSVSRRNWTSL